jgi:hypothetical protein
MIVGLRTVNPGASEYEAGVVIAGMGLADDSEMKTGYEFYVLKFKISRSVLRITYGGSKHLCDACQ